MMQSGRETQSTFPYVKSLCLFLMTQQVPSLSSRCSKVQNLQIMSVQRITARVLSSDVSSSFQCAEEYRRTQNWPEKLGNTRFLRKGRWAKSEHLLFLEAFKIHGAKWGLVKTHVGTRTLA